jgi:hypothetical protein
MNRLCLTHPFQNLRSLWVLIEEKYTLSHRISCNFRVFRTQTFKDILFYSIVFWDWQCRWLVGICQGEPWTCVYIWEPSWDSYILYHLQELRLEGRTCVFPSGGVSFWSSPSSWYEGHWRGPRSLSSGALAGWDTIHKYRWIQHCSLPGQCNMLSTFGLE